MRNFIFGLIFVGSVLFVSLTHAKANISTLVNFEGMVVVIAGTAAVLILNTRFYDLLFLFKNFIKLMCIEDKQATLKTNLIQCTKSFERGQIPAPTGDEWIDTSIEWISTGLRGNELESLLNEKQSIMLDQLYRCASILQNLSKYPPALGMIGTVIGIISIFQGLGQEGGQAMLGQNLGVAMSSTLYGLILANFLINPIAELVIQSIQKREEEISFVISTAKLWAQRENTIYIQEHIDLHDAA